MTNDSIADALTRIRNAQRAGHKSVIMPAIHSSVRLLELLKREGFIESFKVQTNAESGFEECNVVLKYFSSGEPVMGRATRISTPGRRVFCSADKLPTVKNGLGIAVISTSMGLMSDREARLKKVGGEIWATVG